MRKEGPPGGDSVEENMDKVAEILADPGNFRVRRNFPFSEEEQTKEEQDPQED